MEPYQIDQTIRLEKLIKSLNINQIEFAKSLGMAQSNISRMVSGKGQVSVEILNRIFHVYTKVNLHWLLTGDGEMFLSEVNTPRQVDESPAPIVVKGRLEELETRLEWLETIVKDLVKTLNNKS